MYKNPSTVVPDLCMEAARQLQSTTAGGGKSLIIARLPQCQVHLPLPHHNPQPSKPQTSTSSPGSAWRYKKKKGGGKKKTGSDLLAHTVYSKSVFSVSCAAENDQAAVGLARRRGRGREREEKWWKICNLTEFTRTQTHFSLSNQPSRHESSWGEKTEEGWTLLPRPGRRLWRLIGVGNRSEEERAEEIHF